MDDLTILEVINLASVRLASHNVTAQIPSNIPVHNQIINPFGAVGKYIYHLFFVKLLGSMCPEITITFGLKDTLERILEMEPSVEMVTEPSSLTFLVIWPS